MRQAKATPKELPPIAGGSLDLALVLIAALSVVLVGLLFRLDVNRVFDVPKAIVLKVGGCGIFLIWLLYGLFGRGWPWKSARIFIAPITALTLATIISTLLSIDVPMSLKGVYERQFGLQGFLGCVGLFVVTATCLRSRRGAFAAFAVLALVGGAIGTYSLLQGVGADPFGFFKEPHNKTYSFLGNATFAGNALALIFPLSFIIATVASVKTLKSEEKQPPPLTAFLVGVFAISGIQLLPGLSAFRSNSSWLVLAIILSFGLALAAALAGSYGPTWSRVQDEKTQRSLDAFASGALFSAVIGIFLGIICTRTRGGWVGSALALFLGAVLLPKLFAGTPALQRRVRLLTWGSFGVLIVGAAVFIAAFPEHVYSKTILSIPRAFDPQREVVGRGQGTRPYLWKESPRVIFNHGDTLNRLYEDENERAGKVKTALITDVPLSDKARSASAQASDRAWRKIEVWFFGIGIETYRYAFMSHKSKKLESLDPMTNHDNPHNNYLYVLASFGFVGLGAYLWLLGRLLRTAYRSFNKREDTLAARAVAFGVLISFFSYAVYSIAGFDSVACSVFFYFFLGAAAVFFEPSGSEPRLSLMIQAKRQWAEFRKRDPETVKADSPVVLSSVVIAALLGGLLVHTVFSAWTVYRAEQAFVGGRRRTLDDKIDDIKSAIRMNPTESYYKQSLGGEYANASRQFRGQAARAMQAGQQGEALQLKKQADTYAERAETALYAALEHAWAPENIFISLFQVYYAWQRYDEAEHALERALEHSPHLGTVRANLAVLKLERRAYEAAYADCKWVLEVDPRSVVALRTCGRAAYFMNNLTEANTYLAEAAGHAPNDEVVKRYKTDLFRAMHEAGTGTKASSLQKP